MANSIPQTKYAIKDASSQKYLRRDKSWFLVQLDMRELEMAKLYQNKKAAQNKLDEILTLAAKSLDDVKRHHSHLTQILNSYSTVDISYSKARSNLEKFEQEMADAESFVYNAAIVEVEESRTEK